MQRVHNAYMILRAAARTEHVIKYDSQPFAICMHLMLAAPRTMSGRCVRNVCGVFSGYAPSKYMQLSRLPGMAVQYTSHRFDVGIYFNWISTANTIAAAVLRIQSTCAQLK